MTPRGRRTRASAEHYHFDPVELTDRLLELQESYGLEVARPTTAFEHAMTPSHTTSLTPVRPDPRDLHSKVVDTLRDLALILALVLFFSKVGGARFFGTACNFIFLSFLCHRLYRITAKQWSVAFE